MAYIKKDVRKLIISMDETFKYDKDVRKWVKKTIYPQHNLIIKTKDGCYCTNCGKTFFTKNKINIETICPKCKATLLIKSKTLKIISMLMILGY